MRIALLGARDTRPNQSVYRWGSLHARPRRRARSLWGSQVGETGAQRVRRWAQESDAALLALAERLGVTSSRPRSRKWWSERVKEARRL